MADLVGHKGKEPLCKRFCTFSCFSVHPLPWEQLPLQRLDTLLGKVTLQIKIPAEIQLLNIQPITEHLRLWMFLDDFKTGAEILWAGLDQNAIGLEFED